MRSETPFYKNPTIRFLITLLLLYILWYVLYNLWIHPQETFDLFVIDLSISISKWILEHLGYAVFTGAERVIGIDGTGGLWIGDNCNAIELFAQFSLLIVAYKGTIKNKLIFISLGILSIELLNICRIVGLAILDTFARSWTEFNHTYTFKIVIYAYIFMLWMYWVNNFSKPKTDTKENQTI